MKVLIALLALTATVLSIPMSPSGHMKCVPKKLDFSRPDDWPFDQTSSCGMCLDLVEILRVHEDCHRRHIDRKLQDKCDSYSHQGVLDQICRIFVDSVHDEAAKYTEKNPTKLCSLFLDCDY